MMQTIISAMTSSNTRCDISGSVRARRLDIRRERRHVWVVGLIDPGFEVGRFVNEIRCDVTVLGRPCKFEQHCRVTREIVPVDHQEFPYAVRPQAICITCEHEFRSERNV
jgi:hypothetical protein